jgi:hypothetical protein
MRSHTLRGVIQPDEYDSSVRIQLNKGILSDTGWRVVYFRIAIADPVVGDEDVGAKLATSELTNGGNVAGQVWDWADTREVAWAGQFSPNNTYRRNDGSWTPLIDMDNIVYEDLYIYAGSDDGSSRGICYFIIIEEIELSPEQKSFSIIRARAQDLD